MRRLLVLLALAAAGVPAAPERAADLARRIREAGFDPEECYRVRDLALSREDVRFFFTDGYLIFGKPVAGRRISAFFTAEVEDGDAELLVLPPHRGERLALASFTGTPNLSEHLRSVLMIFTDDTARKLAEAASGAKKSAEMGAVLAGRWDTVLANLASSFEVRLVGDLLSSPASPGFFFGAVAGNKLGNFDVLVDTRALQQILIGQVAVRDNRAFFDTWAAFEARGFRHQPRPPAEPEFKLEDFRIEVTLGEKLRLHGVTRAKMTPAATSQVFPFEVSRQMRVREVRIDAETVESFQRESFRAGLIAGGDNDSFLVVAPRPLEKGRKYEIEFWHEGDVVLPAGNGVYYVGARGTWYPRRGMQFASYDLTFRYPAELNLVATGEVVEDRVEGAQRITRRRTSSPVRLAGFNLGEYVRAGVSRGAYNVEVFGNRKLEAALQPKPREVLLTPPPAGTFPRTPRRPAGMDTIPAEPPAPNPTARLETLAQEIAASLEFMAAHFGPAPLKTLIVAPIPGTFGQGFPGLVYLSTLSYLNAQDRPAGLRSEEQRVFFSEMLHAHEVAHQWWGNTVTAAGYEDEWLMESLANYSALMALEKRKGTRALDTVLEEYRTHLLRKTEGGATIESAGPIVWGVRLSNSQTPGAWRTIVYEKGSWIVHMLRRRLGDQRFLEMLGVLRRQYEYRTLTTAQFRESASRFLAKGDPDAKLEGFFDTWVYGTGIPSLKLSWSLKGKAPALRVEGTVTRSDVDEEFGVHVPVEIQIGRGKPLVHWVWVEKEPGEFSVPLKLKPLKVSLAGGNAVLSR